MAEFLVSFGNVLINRPLDQRAVIAELAAMAAVSGHWPLAPGEKVGGALASAVQPEYWRGFQRRWATGLELERLRPRSEGQLPSVHLGN